MPPVTYTTAVVNIMSARICILACIFQSRHTATSSMCSSEIEYHSRITATNSVRLTLVTVRLVIASSIASTQVMTIIRTLTSHSSQVHSLKLLPLCTIVFRSSFAKSMSHESAGLGSRPAAFAGVTFSPASIAQRLPLKLL